mmetsp:Transcript_4285/g.15842  ORF Transcript_4285/g.15842 Transcript_4285/m.15842 type:complete len:239 (+) Transcript_4285:1303-2019(+)
MSPTATATLARRPSCSSSFFKSAYVSGDTRANRASSRRAFRDQVPSRDASGTYVARVSPVSCARASSFNPPKNSSSSSSTTRCASFITTTRASVMAMSMALNFCLSSSLNGASVADARASSETRDNLAASRANPKTSAPHRADASPSSTAFASRAACSKDAAMTSARIPRSASVLAVARDRYRTDRSSTWRSDVAARWNASCVSWAAKTSGCLTAADSNKLCSAELKAGSGVKRRAPA